MARGWDAPADEQEFDGLALEIHAWQASRIPNIARISSSLPRGCAADVRGWREIPLVPTALFADHDIFAYRVDEAERVFVSSGTTRAQRGRHYFRDLSFYRAACLSGALWALGEAGESTGRGWNVRSFMPDDPASSLAAMIEGLAGDLKTSCRDVLSREAHRSVSLPFTAMTPTLVIGPAWAYMPLIESGAREPLPAGSVVVETGGYKGRTREATRDELYDGLCRVFEVPRERVISEYGMCEITTPLWERAGSASSPALRGFVTPPWVRVRLLDPETLSEAPAGVIAIYDLANVASSIGVLTADAGCLRDGRLVLEGRLSGAAAKGCSLTVPIS